jgi:hypothetical protein
MNSITKIGKGIGQVCCWSPTVFNLYKEYITKEALQGCGDVQIGRKVIRIVKYADDLTLLDMEETLLQGMTERLIGTGRSNGVKMNVEKPRS